ncbi:molybdopterin-guanine dinucleotide biosynthesis protein B [Undibacterium sp.]|uniref:molybdopterin-guanine dinucleotide biosynthesis protein B n=1 Tax=Undibacterium sp. TaxID=1914977 RepID=UPI00374DE090
MGVHILGVVGWSGSGKTTMLELLLPQLSALGKVVNVVKHSHHDISLEPERKDSSRLRKAGAAEVLLASPYRYAVMHELREQPEPSLMELLVRLNPADLVLVEGYKWEANAKLEIHRQAVGKPALYPDDPNIIAVAADIPAPQGLRDGLAWLDLNQPAMVLDWLLAALSAGALSTGVKS